MESIEKNLNGVGVGETSVTAILRNDNILWLRIKTYDSDIQVPLVVCEADFRFFRGDRSFVRLLLDETCSRQDLLPDGLTDQAVQYRRRIDALSVYPLAGLLALL